LGIDNRVRFLGWQGRAELPKTYLGANLFVYPSRHEGMPNAVLEAMASGLPVLATRIAGNEDLVSAETGVLVPPEDAAALQAALQQLLADAALRQRLGAAAPRHIQGQYSWQGVTQAYLDLMRKIVGRR